MTTDDFYVGYQSDAPPKLKKFLRPVLAALVIGSCAVAGALAARQNAFAPATFEFGTERMFTGVLALQPWPILFDRAGGHVLFGAGKHGFKHSFAEGAVVRLRGSAVALGDSRGIQVTSAEMGAMTGGKHVPDRVPLGPVSVAGEIVDSKCYFGVMNPGSGKVHRDCAVRCISGGIPPALLVRDAAGTTRTILLAHVPTHLLVALVAERVRVSGQLHRIGSLLILEADPSGLHRE